MLDYLFKLHKYVAHMFCNKNLTGLLEKTKVDEVYFHVDLSIYTLLHVRTLKCSVKASASVILFVV